MNSHSHLSHSTTCLEQQKKTSLILSTSKQNKVSKDKIIIKKERRKILEGQSKS